MKTLLLIRHAKAEWGQADSHDVDRELHAQGRSDAPIMAKHIAEHGYVPEAFIVSSACRAAQTASLMAPYFTFPAEDIEWRDELYLASLLLLLDSIKKTSSHINTLALLAHNPGITMLVHQLCPLAPVTHVPTCGVVILQLDSNVWNTNHGSTKFIRFDCPKHVA